MHPHRLPSPNSSVLELLALWDECTDANILRALQSIFITLNNYGVANKCKAIYSRTHGDAILSVHEFSVSLAWSWIWWFPETWNESSRNVPQMITKYWLRTEVEPIGWEEIGQNLLSDLHYYLSHSALDYHAKREDYWSTYICKCCQKL
jgi:hypothetical protein